MPPTLTKAEVAAGALAIINEHGPDRVTARALGSELHVAPATLYTVFDSLGSVDTAARELLLERLEPVLEAVEATGDLSAFWTWAVESRHSALFLTDPTSAHLDLAHRLFPQVEDHGQVADLQAIAHSVLAASAVDADTAADMDRTASVLLGLYRSTGARAVQSVSLPDLPAQPSLLELSNSLIEESGGSSRSMAVRQIGVDLIVSEGLDGWAFRRVVEESGVPLTTLHRLGDRKTHLQQAFGDLAEAAWRRGGLAGGDEAVRIGLTVRELISAGVPSLMDLLRQPVAVGDELGPLVRIDLAPGPDHATRTVIPADALLRAIASIVVSRFLRSEEAPGPWGEMAEFATALVAGWRQ